MSTWTERQLDQEHNAKKLLQLNERDYVELAVQLRIATALEAIADFLKKTKNV